MPPLATDSSPAIWVRSALYAGLYLVAMVACIMLGRFGAQVTPIWLPSTILAWVLLSSPQRQWPIVLTMVAAAHLAGAFIVRDQLPMELIFLVANIVSPTLLVWLLQRRGDALAFEDRDEVLRFLLYAGVVAAVSAAIATAAAPLMGGFNFRFTAIWFLADGLSFVVFLPLFRVVASNGWKRLFAPDMRTRVFVLLGILVAAHLASALLPATIYRVFLMLLVPYLIYIAFDAGMTAARAALAISAVMLLAVVLFAPAPPDRGFDPQSFLVSMQIYLAVTVACVLPISAALEERKRLYEAASEALHDAQEAWGGLIAAEAQFRLIADNSTDLILRLRGDGDILFASPAWTSLVQDADALNGTKLASLVRPEERDHLAREIDTLVCDGAFDRPRHWQIRLRDMNDTWRLFDVRATLITSDEFVAVVRQVQE